MAGSDFIVEGSGTAALNSAAPWRIAPPCPSHKGTEDRVGKSEDPQRSLVEEQVLNPMFNETALIGGLTGLLTQARLKVSEHAVLPEPCLQNHDGNGENVSRAQPEVVDPSPATPVADKNSRQTQDDKHHHCEMQQKDGIGENLVRHGNCPATPDM